MLRKTKLKPDISVHVAVGNMMHQLIDRPATAPVRRLQLRFIEVQNCSFKRIGQEKQVAQCALLRCFRKCCIKGLTNGILALYFHCLTCLLSITPLQTKAWLRQGYQLLRRGLRKRGRKVSITSSDCLPSSAEWRSASRVLTGLNGR